MRTKVPQDRLELLLADLSKVGYAVAKNPDLWASLSRGGDWDLVVADLPLAESHLLRLLGQPQSSIRRSYVWAYLYSWGEIDLLPGLLWRMVLLASGCEVIRSARISPPGISVSSPAYQAMASWIGPLLSSGSFKERTRETVRAAVDQESKIFEGLLLRIFGTRLTTQLLSLARDARPEQAVHLRHVLRRAAVLRSMRRHPVVTVSRAANFASREALLRLDPPLPALRLDTEDDLERVFRWQREAFPAVPGVIFYDPRRRLRVELQGAVARARLGDLSRVDTRGYPERALSFRERLRLAKDQSRGWLVILWDGTRHHSSPARKSLLLANGTSTTAAGNLTSYLSAYLGAGSGSHDGSQPS